MISRRRPIALLALIPASALSFAIPLVNRVEPRILGLPFLVAWIVLWWVVTPLFLWIIYRSDKRS